MKTPCGTACDGRSAAAGLARDCTIRLDSGMFFRAIGTVAGAGVIALTLGACSDEVPRGYQGYAEGEYVRVAAPYAGMLQRLAVKRGGQVKAGDALFVLEQENEAAARRE